MFPERQATSRLLPARRAAAICTGVWALLVASGLAVLAAYQALPGQPAEGRASWPAAAGFPFDKSRPTLVMLAHPECPCTRASLRELEQIEGESGGRFSAHVIFIDVTGNANRDSAPLEMARGIAGVQVHVEAMPGLAKIWGAHTSGQVLLYDQDGHLRFSGGITPSRGHEGLNSGHRVIVSFLRTGQLLSDKAPVFGCSLLGGS